MLNYTVIQDSGPVTRLYLINQRILPRIDNKVFELEIPVAVTFGLSTFLSAWTIVWTVVYSLQVSP